MRRKLKHLIESIKTQSLREVADRLTSTVEYRTRGLLGAHHTGVEGLLTHSVEVAEAAVALNKAYGNKCDNDILIFCGLLHDIALAEDPKDHQHGIHSAWLSTAELMSNTKLSTKKVELISDVIEFHHIKAFQPTAPREALILSLANRISAGNEELLVEIRCLED